VDWLTEYDGLWSVVFCESRIIMICEKNLMSLYFVAKDCFKKSFRKPHPKSTDVNYAGQLVTNAWLFSVAITLAQIAQYWRYSLSPSRFCTVCCVFCQMFVFIFMSVVMGIIFFELDLSRNGLQSRWVSSIIMQFAHLRYCVKKHTQSNTDRQAEQISATYIFMM